MSRYWRYCPKCEKAVAVEGLPAYDSPWPLSVTDALDEAMEEHQFHYCNTCKNHFAECKGNPEFGNCVGNDNVVSCDKHEPR